MQLKTFHPIVSRFFYCSEIWAHCKGWDLLSQCVSTRARFVPQKTPHYYSTIDITHPITVVVRCLGREKLPKMEMTHRKVFA